MSVPVSVLAAPQVIKVRRIKSIVTFFVTMDVPLIPMTDDDEEDEEALMAAVFSGMDCKFTDVKQIATTHDVEMTAHEIVDSEIVDSEEAVGTVDAQPK